MSFDLLVFVGRFQPVHNGHMAVIEQALQAGRKLLVLTGSARRARTLRNPFTAAERREMIEACLSPADRERVCIEPLEDVLYDDASWIANVQQAAERCLAQCYPDQDPQNLRVGLVGHSKDQSSYYLKLFPTWGAVDVSNHEGLSATALRKDWLSGAASTEAELQARVPAAVQRWLAEFATGPAYAELQAEQAYISNYQAAFAGMRYAPTFNTADALVTHHGKVLLVRRGRRPGRGLLAMPGGFIDGDETALAAALRELREETRLDVPEEILRGSLMARDFFDDPNRSMRGRTFSAAFHFDLPPMLETPTTQAGDDAADTLWLPLSELDPETLFDDHYDIIRKLTAN